MRPLLAPLISLSMASAPMLGCTALVGVDDFTKVDGLDADVESGVGDGSAPLDGSVPLDGSAPLDGSTGGGSDGSVPKDSAAPPTDTYVAPVDMGPPCPAVTELSTKGGATGLALAPSDLFWGLNCGPTQTCPKAGCPAGSTTVTGIPLTCTTAIAASGANMYVIGPSSDLWTCTLPGCTSPKSNKLVTGSFGIGGHRALFADASGAYVQDQLTSGERYMAKLPAGGGAACKLGLLPAADVLGLAVLGSRLYVTHGSSPNLALGWFPTDCSGGAAGIQAFVSEREGLSSIVAAGTAIYWTEKASIVKCDNPPSCTGTTFAGGLDSHPRALASDASSLYWMTAAGIFSCPLSGCVVGPKRLSCEGCPTDDYASSSRMPSLAVDDAYVYAGCPGRGRVIRVAK